MNSFFIFDLIFSKTDELTFFQNWWIIFSVVLDFFQNQLTFSNSWTFLKFLDFLSNVMNCFKFRIFYVFLSKVNSWPVKWPAVDWSTVIDGSEGGDRGNLGQPSSQPRGRTNCQLAPIRSSRVNFLWLFKCRVIFWPRPISIALLF